jgi:hypothetical protein
LAIEIVRIARNISKEEISIKENQHDFLDASKKKYFKS